MGNVNRKYPEDFKAQVLAEYTKGGTSLAKLADKHDLYPQMIVRWRREVKKPGKKVVVAKKPAKRIKSK